MAEERDNMAQVIINASLITAPNGEPVLNDEQCYSFFMLDGTERQVNVPATLVDFTQESMLLPLTGNTLVNLLIAPMAQVYDEAQGDKSTSDGSSSTAEWSDNTSKLLSELYKTNKALVESRKTKTMKKMWEIIRDAMATQGYAFTAQQCESKWKALERSYKKFIDNKTATGRGRKNCPYEKELGEIFTKRQTIFPTLTMGTGQPVTRSVLMEESGVVPGEDEESSSFENLGEDSLGSFASATPSPPTTNPSTSVKKPSTPTLCGRSVQKELQELRRVVEERNKTKLQLEEKKLEQKAEFLKQLSLKNELMKKYLDAKLGNTPTSD